MSLNHAQNVEVRREAVSDRSGEIRFAFPHEEPSLVAGPILEGDDLDTLTVPSISLDDFIRQTELPVQFIKMDVEGAETAVLRGAIRTLSTFHPALIVELHYDPSQKGPHPAISLLEKLGYQIEWLNEVAVCSHVFARWIPDKSENK